MRLYDVAAWADSIPTKPSVAGEAASAIAPNADAIGAHHETPDVRLSTDEVPS